MKKVPILLLVVLFQFAFAQDPPVQVRFERSDYLLYKGYVNRVQIHLLFVSGKHPRYKFQAIARGAAIEYDEAGVVRILPTEPEVRLRIFTETKDKVYLAGNLTFKSIPAPDDAAFKELRLPKTLSKPVNYNLTGKNVVNDLDIIPEIESTPIVILAEGVEQKMNLVVTQKYDEFYRRLLEDYNVKSDDAEVKKVSRVVFVVKPNLGAKSCKLVVSTSYEEVGQVTVPVVPK